MPTYTGTVGPNAAPPGALPQLGATSVRDPLMRVDPTGAPVPTSGTPAVMPGAQLDPNQQYLTAFNASLAKQRQGIDTALAASLGQLGARRDLAAKTIVGGAGDIAKQYANAGQENAVQQQTNAAAATQGPGGAVGGDANAALYQKALATMGTGDKQAEPLLQLAAQANYDSGHAMLDQQRLAGQQQVDQQEAQFAQQQQLMQMQSNLSNPAYDPAHDATLQRNIYLSNHPELQGLAGNDNTPYAATPQAQMDKFAQRYNFPNASALQQTMQDPMYGWAARALAKQPGQKGTDGHGDTLNWQQVLQHVGGNGYIISALLANGAITLAQAKAYASSTAAPPA